MESKRWTRRVLAVLFAGVLIAFAGGAGTAGAEDEPPLPVPHQVFNGVIGVTADSSTGTVGESTYKNPSSPICGPVSAPNTDCEGVAPHNETSIAVNPTNAQNIVGSANDYQLRLSSGGAVNETIYSRAHVSFDGGGTWTTYPINFNGYAATGDPAVAFDADGRAYLATLGFVWSQNIGCCVNPDILVATSGNGGRNWTSPARVASGSGTFGSPGVLNDKEYLTAWGHGNAIVTWTVFNDGQFGSYINSPIYASVTHDGGKTWSAGVQISGSASFCRGVSSANACDQDQASVPVVAADGSIYVTFVNYSNDPNGRDQYLVVKVDPATGRRIAGPFLVGGVVDGFTDYPLNIDGRQTYQDSQFRSWSVGNIAADPTNAQHLAVAWSDMRNSTLPAPRDPYAAKTNSDIIVSQSTDGGATWSAPAAITRRGDQFQPWAAFDTSGRLRIGFFDRSYDSANHKYAYTLATQTTGGYAFARLSGLSDPTQGTRWFSGRTPNPAFPHPTTFLGDYSGIAATPSGGAVALWTDMTQNVCFATRCGSGENAFFGSR